MKITTLLDVFKRKKHRLISLEYVIICQNSGQPIYAKCWGNVCGMLGKKDELMTAFLAALSTMPTMFAESDNQLHNMSIGSLKLMFCHTESQNIISLAFPENNVNENTMEIIEALFEDIEQFLNKDYQETPWDRLNDPKVQLFEKELLKKVIHPWFYRILPNTKEKHEVNCPICMPMILQSCS
ncbi:MAG: hypothetical protein JSW11_17950 [Candidatus Heimdallarchaeota archaeon]|nr:MAG: hypothetical protein JSW11_17950 [Candidatus Heimdallarchaeota archaeon]